MRNLLTAPIAALAIGLSGASALANETCFMVNKTGLEMAVKPLFEDGRMDWFELVPVEADASIRTGTGIMGSVALQQVVDLGTVLTSGGTLRLRNPHEKGVMGRFTCQVSGPDFSFRLLYDTNQICLRTRATISVDESDVNIEKLPIKFIRSKNGDELTLVPKEGDGKAQDPAASQSACCVIL